jgi:predicted GNAT superfamily acetyltransferase
MASRYRLGVLTLSGVTEVRQLRELDELHAASETVTAVWGDPALATASLLRAYAHNGNPVLGAYDDGALVGVSIGFVAVEPELHLHSHITCVLPNLQHGGIGHILKQAQRDWCRSHSIDLITWTFDPLLARNAYFNLHKLGATARAVLPNFYGSMDDEFNRGERTDRMEAWWRFDAPRATDEVALVVDVPADYLALRATDPVRAAQVRAEVVTALAGAFADGLVATDFDRDRGYVFTRS